MRDNLSGNLWYQCQRKIVPHSVDNRQYRVPAALVDDARRFGAAGQSHQWIFIAVNDQRWRFDGADDGGSIATCGDREQLTRAAGGIVGSPNVLFAYGAAVRRVRRIGAAADCGKHVHHAVNGALDVTRLRRCSQ